MIEVTDYNAQLIFQWTDTNMLTIKDFNDEVLFIIEGCINFTQALNFYKDVKLS